ncbi:gliding motility-associated C-terminal domain-containing protein [Aquimarina aquimarini]|uniref:T9SS type B sorting domain-containing protein n=1 Tax=Aquimarina aquimarini TaxID=1191734 RepID=UPI000D55B670|nr:gliding motility-associated C-terminal domain-containing protein [Aquimarina aquimarini]
MRKNTFLKKGAKYEYSNFWKQFFLVLLLLFSTLHVETLKGAGINKKNFINGHSKDGSGIETVYKAPLVMCSIQQSGFWSISGTTALYDFGDGVIARITTTTANPFISGNFNPAGTGFWSNGIEGDVSIENIFTWDSTLTVSFEDGFGNPVNIEDPILHIDRLGGLFGTQQNSAEVTLQGGLTWTFLGGTNDFQATTTTVRDAGAGTPVGSTPGLESSLNDDDGSAAGSLRINGVITSFTLQFVQAGVAGFGNDDIEFMLEVCTTADTDNDGIPDVSDICMGYEDDIDIDNDNVADGCDLDDDNDGILDIDEGACQLIESGSWTIAGTTATYDFGNGVIAKLTTTNPDPFVLADFNPLGAGFWSENLGGNVSLENEYHWDSILTINFEDALGNPIQVTNPILHFDRIGGVFGTHQNSAEITLLDGLTWAPLEGTSDFRTRPTTVRDGGVEIIPPTGATGESTENDADGSAAGSLRVHGNVSTVRLQFVQSGINAFGKDKVEIILSVCNNLDSDNDGVPNYLDLDSDNDGIYDAEEAGHMQPHTNGVVDGTFGTDGIPDLVQGTSGANSGVVDYSIADSEVTPDGVPDFIDSDSDDDGCDDVIEAGYTDGDTNGYLGIGTFGVGLTVDANGRVTSRSDGYTGTNTNVTTAGAPPVITVQPSNSIICANTDTTFEVTATDVNTYQWQLFNGTTWDDLTDTGIYSTTTTNVLTITNASITDNGNQYRVVLSNSSYLCATQISDVKILTVNALPTISVTSLPSCSIDMMTYSLEVTVSAGVVTSTSGIVTNVSGNLWSISEIPLGTDTDITVNIVTTCEKTITVNTPICNIEANDDHLVIDGETGGNSINIVDDNDTINGNGAILGTDVTMTVTDSDLGDGVSIDPITGEVIVLPNTSPGDYIFTYTLCSIVDPLICDDATVTVEVIGVANMELIKTGVYVDANNDNAINAGDEIHYSFTVENTGNLTITNILLSDPLPGIEVIGGPIDLEVGEQDTDSFTATYVLTEEDLLRGSVSNQATVTGLDSDGNDITDISDDPFDETNVDIDGDGDFEDITVLLIEPSDEVEIYTGISPNGDGVNDQFRIIGLHNFSNNTLRIFNRWGVMVFEEDAYEQPGARFFEGVSNGRATINSEKRLPVGTYYYVLEYENTSGIARSKAGYLYINR